MHEAPEILFIRKNMDQPTQPPVSTRACISPSTRPLSEQQHLKRCRCRECFKCHSVSLLSVRWEEHEQEELPADSRVLRLMCCFTAEPKINGLIFASRLRRCIVLKYNSYFSARACVTYVLVCSSVFTSDSHEGLYKEVHTRLHDGIGHWPRDWEQLWIKGQERHKTTTGRLTTMTHKQTGGITTKRCTMNTTGDRN